MGKKVINVFRKNNKADDLDDILVDIYDLILSKVNSKLKEEEDFSLINKMEVS